MTTDPSNQDASDSGEHDMVLPARSKTAPHAEADAEHGRGALERAGVGGPPSTDPAAASAQHTRKRLSGWRPTSSSRCKPLADRQQRTASAVMRDAVAGRPARP